MSDKIREAFHAEYPISREWLMPDGTYSHEPTQCGWDGFNSGWQAALAQQGAPVAVPDGFRLVPVEPTPEMVEAYSLGKHRVLPAYVGAKEKADARVVERYRAMLAAAPTAPVAVGQRPDTVKVSRDLAERIAPQLTWNSDEYRELRALLGEGGEA